MRHATMADYEAKQPARTEAARVYLAQLEALTRQPPVASVSETLQAPPPSGTPVKWMRANTLTPAVGKSAELAHLLGDVQRATEREGRQALLVDRWGPEAGAFFRVFLYASLAELDEQVAANRQSDQMREVLARRDQLISRLVSSDLGEVLIPFAA